MNYNRTDLYLGSAHSSKRGYAVVGLNVTCGDALGFCSYDVNVKQKKNSN